MAAAVARGDGRARPRRWPAATRRSPPAPDEWIKRLGTLPLLYQPGEHWLYNVGSDVLGVLIAAPPDQPFDEFMRDRVFEPLGMVDTGLLDTERRPARHVLRPRPRDW